MEHTSKRVRLGRLVSTLSIAALAASLALLPACTPEDLERILQSCPSDPADQGGIDWTPDVGAPVFYGHQDLTPADGALRNLRVYYPTVDGSPADAPILKRCLVRWPAVLFLHGQPPNELPDSTDYHLQWEQLASTMARSGYVVVVPALSSDQTFTDPPAARDAALADLDWIRTEWADAAWVNQQDAAVVGHSLGGMLATYVAEARPDIRALVSLSGVFLLDGRLQQVRVPSLLMWADGLPAEDLDQLNIWNQLSMPRYGAVFPGQHFDYLRQGVSPNTPRGQCQLVGPAAADLATLFLSLHLPVPLSVHHGTVDLQPPSVQLTQEQKFFAGGHFSGLSGFESAPVCQLHLRWDLNGTTGERQIS
jgi:pimeloyl-ACP methyl ester carboxylesterase